MEASVDPARAWLGVMTDVSGPTTKYVWVLKTVLATSIRSRSRSTKFGVGMEQDPGNLRNNLSKSTANWETDGVSPCLGAKP